MSVLEWINLYREDDGLKFTNLGPFDIMLMDWKVTTNTTTLWWINSFKVLIYGGNYNGVIGYGKGSGHNGQVAMKKALENFK